MVRVRPTVPHQMHVVQQPRALYARAAVPPALPGALQRAGGRFFAADGPDLSAGRVEAIDGNEPECSFSYWSWHHHFTCHFGRRCSPYPSCCRTYKWFWWWQRQQPWPALD